MQYKIYTCCNSIHLTIIKLGIVLAKDEDAIIGTKSHHLVKVQVIVSLIK